MKHAYLAATCKIKTKYIIHRVIVRSAHLFTGWLDNSLAFSWFRRRDRCLCISVYPLVFLELFLLLSLASFRRSFTPYSSQPSRRPLKGKSRQVVDLVGGDAPGQSPGVCSTERRGICRTRGKAWQRRRRLQAAIAWLRQSVRPTDRLFASGQTEQYHNLVVRWNRSSKLLSIRDPRWLHDCFEKTNRFIGSRLIVCCGGGGERRGGPEVRAPRMLPVVIPNNREFVQIY